LARIIELTIDTDDKIDPSYGVVVFLALSAATEVAAIICSCLPVIVPQAFKEYKSYKHPSWRSPHGNYSGRAFSTWQSQNRKSRHFKAIDDPLADDELRLASSEQDWKGPSIGLQHVGEAVTTAAQGPASTKTDSSVDEGTIRVDREIEVHFGTAVSKSSEERDLY
jgi:hypothetical protein